MPYDPRGLQTTLCFHDPRSPLLSGLPRFTWCSAWLQHVYQLYSPLSTITHSAQQEHIQPYMQQGSEVLWHSLLSCQVLHFLHLCDKKKTKTKNFPINLIKLALKSTLSLCTVWTTFLLNLAVLIRQIQSNPPSFSGKSKNKRFIFSAVYHFPEA